MVSRKVYTRDQAFEIVLRIISIGADNNDLDTDSNHCPIQDE
jgi:hypothetical protein